MTGKRHFTDTIGKRHNRKEAVVTTSQEEALGRNNFPGKLNKLPEGSSNNIFFLNCELP